MQQESRSPGGITECKSSRIDRRHAGWREPEAKGNWPALVDERKDPRWTQFSWLAVKSLLDSANDKVAKNVHDLVNATRMRWVRHALAHERFMRADPWKWAALQKAKDWSDETVDDEAESITKFSFLLVGDPGEADASQYAVVEALETKSNDIAFMLIGSDVIYPAGDVNDYANAFFLPYKRWVRDRVPILAIPGNHDWYDGLNGFMLTFCGVDALPPTAYRWTSYTITERVAKLIWRASSRPEPTRLLELRDGNPYENPPRRIPEPVQPGPYFIVDTRHLRIVAIDTGITGTLDREQGEWLRFVSKGAKPKLLVTGKPIYVDNEYHPGQIQWTSEGPSKPTVDDIVRDPDNNYVAAIGCDIHNYQRYCVRLRPRNGDDENAAGESEERRIEYIVAGGSGAYLGATHKIDKIDMRLGKTKDFPKDVFPITEEDFRCYPLRGDSVAYYSRSFGSYLRQWALLSLLLPAVLALLYLWPDIRLDREIRHGNDGFLLWHAVLASLAGIGAPALFGLLIAGIASAAPRGYRGFAGVLLALTAVVAALWLMDDQEWWKDQWEVVLVTNAAIFAPIVAILLGYYYRGVGPRLTHDLLVVITAMCMVLLIVEDFDIGGSAEKVFLQLWIGLGILAVGATALGWIRKHFQTPTSRRWYRRVVMALFAVGMGFIWHRWEDAWLFPTIAISVGVIATLAFIVFWVIVISSRAVAGLVLGGLGGRGLGGRTVDPDEAVREVANRYDLDDDPDASPRILRYRAAKKVSARTKRAVNCLLTDRGQRRRLIDSIVSEAGDANEPPMFKSFLRLEVKEDRNCAAHLLLDCFGVTGWKEDADNPPREDRVRIPLSPRQCFPGWHRMKKPRRRKRPKRRRSL